MRFLSAILMWGALMAVANAAGMGGADVSQKGLSAFSDRIKAEDSRLHDLAYVGDVLFAVGELGLIMKSEDDGLTWAASFAPSTRTLVSIEALQGDLVFAVGHGGTILRSGDAGESWELIEVGEANGESFLGIIRADNGRLIAHGAYGMLFKSDDNGYTWQKQEVFEEFFDWHVTGIVNHGDLLVMVGESETLAYSEDNGESWIKMESPYDGSYFGAMSVDDVLMIYGMIRQLTI